MIGVTGSKGVLGKILLRKLIGLGEIDCFSGDIRKKEDILEWIGGKFFDVIFHLAAIVPVAEVNSDPFEAYNVNVGGTINLLDSLREANIKPWLLYSSSSHVYKSSNKQICEMDPIKPLNTYGESKHFAERICDGFRESYGSRICIARIFSCYHETQKPPSLYPSIKLRLCSEDLTEPFFLRGAKSIRDIQNAEVAIDKIIKLMQMRYDGTINIGSGKGISIEDFVRNLSSLKLTISFDPKEEQSFLVADISKLNKVLSS